MPLPTTTNTDLPKAAGLDILIESNYFQIAASPDRPFDISEAAGKVRAADQFITNPEDLGEREESIMLSQVDFSGGEGLDFAHRPTNSEFDRTRFWRSEALEVVEGHGDVQKVQLQKQFSTIFTQADSFTVARQSPQMVEAGESLFMIGNAGDQSLVTRIDDPGGTPSTTVEDPHGTAAVILSIAEVNGEVYVSVDGAGIYQRDTSGTWTSWNGTVNPQRIWGLKGRIVGVGAQGNIREVTESTQPTPVTFAGDAVGLCATDAGSAILVGASNGYVYALADLDGTLTLRAQTSFQGEEVTAVAAGPSGIVLVGTGQGSTSRLYMGEMGSAYTIQNVQLLREWDVNNDSFAHISHIRFTRDSAYFALRTSDPEFQLWRFDATTTGIFHMWTSDTTTAVTAIEVISDEVFFSTHDLDVYGQQTTFQSSGHLISALFDHFDAEDKVWAAAKFFGVNFPAGTEAELFFSTDPDAIEDSGHASWTSIRTLDATSGVDDAETLIAEAESRWITLKIELSTTDTANTPQVRGWSVRAYAGAGDVTFRIPVNVSDYVLRPGRQATRIDGFGLTRYDQLKSYEGTAVTLKWLYTDETFEGTIKAVGTRVPLIPRRGSPLLISQVEFVGRRS